MNNLIPTIELEIETKEVECRVIKTDFTWVVEEPTFGMSKSAYNWYVQKFKVSNLVNRLKRKYE